MTGTITYILSRAGFRAMNGPLADERRRLAGAEPPAAYVSYDPRLLAGAGWYGYRIALNGGDRQMVERARYMLSERYVIRDGYDYYADGVYVFGVLLRERVPRYGTGGGAPTPEPEALNFYMPNGGTISLNKTGNPTVVELEYSLDEGATWTVWQEDANGNRSMTLTAGQRMYVRNTSEITTMFSTSRNDCYIFYFSDITEANGEVNSLLRKDGRGDILPQNKYCFVQLFYSSKLKTPPRLSSMKITEGCYRYMFGENSLLTNAPDLPAVNLAVDCYRGMFRNCVALTISPFLPSRILYNSSYYFMFKGCRLLNRIETAMMGISAQECLLGWLNGVSPTGDFYCPAELTISTGANGIPSGWTRHDI